VQGYREGQIPGATTDAWLRRGTDIPRATRWAFSHSQPLPHAPPVSWGKKLIRLCWFSRASTSIPWDT